MQGKNEWTNLHKEIKQTNRQMNHGKIMQQILARRVPGVKGGDGGVGELGRDCAQAGRSIVQSFS